MNIFISWSGETSKQIAAKLRDWLPMVIQAAKPYYTPSDIEKGSRWETDITKKLNESTVGLICLTRDNIEKPWILFEAGALSSKLDKARVCPILFDLKNSDLTAPLATFQTTEFNRIEFEKLIKSINLMLNEQKIDDSVLHKTFEKFYAEFENDVNLILAETKSPNIIKEPIRSDREILEEILELTRRNFAIKTISEYASEVNTEIANGQDLLRTLSQNLSKQYESVNYHEFPKMHKKPAQ